MFNAMFDILLYNTIDIRCFKLVRNDPETEAHSEKGAKTVGLLPARTNTEARTIEKTDGGR